MKTKRIRWIVIGAAVSAVLLIIVFAVALPKGSLRYTWRRLWHWGEPTERSYRAIFDFVFPLAANDIAGKWKPGTTAREFHFRIDKETDK